MDDGTPGRPLGVTEYVPAACPGSLLPHAWIDGTTSLYDQLGPDFTLLDLGAAAAGVTAFAAAARQLAIPLTVVRPRLADLAGYAQRYGSSLLLVRPDRIVAWRQQRDGPGAGDPAGTARAADVLRTVTGR